jgi:NAD(P)-dependent dehydrogenase (short-subunit alcohol dehydrogenase family)
MQLEGRRILVTGAASGIGFAVARRFGEEGAKVGLLDRDAAALREALSRLGRGAAEAVADVSNEAEVASAVGALASALGGLDGVVNSAGIDLLKPFGETSRAEWSRIMAVNLDGPFHVCQAALPHLKKAVGGTVVNIASGAGLRPLEHRTAYCASKAALVMFTKALAMDLSGDGIRANAICPGIIDTPLFRTSYENAPDPKAELARILDRYVIKRVGQPDDIASAALFLTSRDSSYVTGSAFAIDGGRTFH